MDLSGELFTMGLAMKLQKMTSEGDPDLLEGPDYVIDFPYPFATASNSDFVDPSITPAYNDTEEYTFDAFYRHNLTMTVIYCVAYFIVFFVGLVGNSLVIAVVFRAPRMRTVTNYFIVNLALADFLVIVFCLPATLLSNLYVPWMMGPAMCKTVPYIQGVSVAASVYSLIAVSLDRFLAIWWPLKLQITKRRARYCIIGIWIFSLTTTIPWALFFDLIPVFPDEPDITICVEVWPQGTNGALYFLLANLIMCYVLPMILISICYILIWIKVWRRDIPGDSKDAQVMLMQQKSKFKVVKMLIVVVIMFVLSWLPLYMIFARIKLGGPLSLWEEEFLQIATPIAQWLGSSNSCINPILYAFFNKKYRRNFVAIIKSRKCCGRLSYYENVMLASSTTSTRNRSSHYHNYNASAKKAPLSPSIKSDAVSYIYDNGNGVGIRKHNGITKQDSNLSRQMLLKQDSSVSRCSLLKQDSTVSQVSARQILINNHNKAAAEKMTDYLCRQDSNNSCNSCKVLLKQDSDGSRYLLSKQNYSSSIDGDLRKDTILKKRMLCKQDTEISFIEGHKGSLCSQDSCTSLIPSTGNPKRHRLVKQDSIFSFEPRCVSNVKRHELVKQDSVVSFADQHEII